MTRLEIDCYSCLLYLKIFRVSKIEYFSFKETLLEYSTESRSISQRIVTLRNKKLHLEQELIKANSMLVDQKLDVDSDHADQALSQEARDDYSDESESFLFQMEKEISRLEKLVLNARKNLMMINSFRVWFGFFVCFEIVSFWRCIKKTV